MEESFSYPGIKSNLHETLSSTIYLYIVLDNVYLFTMLDFIVHIILCFLIL